MMRRSTVAVAALMLAACGSQEGNQAAGNAANATVESGGPAGAATVSLRPGQWESSVEIVRVSAPNMPAGMAPPTMPPVTARFCITPEQAANPSAGMIAGSDNQTGCTTENYSMTGGRIRGTVQCNMQGTTSRTTMDGQFTPTNYDMTMQSQQTVSGVSTETEMRVTARRVGDCPAG